MSININGLALSEGRLRYLLQRVFWKQTIDANLNTVDGCDQAATVATDLLALIDSDPEAAWSTAAELPARKGRVPLVVVLRDPDASNEYAVFGGEVITHDMDAGYIDIRDEDEYKAWAEGHLDDALEFERDGYPDAAEYIRSVVASYGERFA